MTELSARALPPAQLSSQPSATPLPSPGPAHLGWRVAASAQAALGITLAGRPSWPVGGCGRPRGTGRWPRAGAQAVGQLQLQLGVHLGVLLGLLVAVVQVLHEHGHHHVDKHELGHQHEGDEVDGRDGRQVGEAVLVLAGALAQRVLRAEGGGQAPTSAGSPLLWGLPSPRPLRQPVPS